MAAEVVVRWLGEKIDEGIIIAWHKNLGDKVENGDVLVEIKTGTTTRQYRSDARGVLLQQGAIKGQKIKLNDILAVVGYAGEEIDRRLHPGLNFENYFLKRSKLIGSTTPPKLSTPKPTDTKPPTSKPPTSKPPASKPPVSKASVKTYKKVFFSYARTDSKIVMKLAEDLKKSGINVWLDQLELRVGKEWDLEIEKALETCDCLLFIVSETSVVSKNVLNEVHYAIEESKDILPVVVNNCKVPLSVRRLHRIDLTSNYDNGLKQLLTALQL